MEELEREGSCSRLYVINRGCISRYDTKGKTETETMDEPKPLCNFDAWVAEQVALDDGEAVQTIFSVEGALWDGSVLPRISVPAEEFGSMGWITGQWGIRPVVYVGVQDHVRVAIQLLSGYVPHTIKYGHTGWRKVNKSWVYLHAGGAIGVNRSDDMVVDLAQLADYHLPQPPAGDALVAAVQASITITEIAPPGVVVPLLMAAYRGPLCEAAPANMSIFVEGPTGSQKTELTALVQAHYGAGFHGKNLPGNWSSTTNALEKQAFLAKDAVFVVDDFAPIGTANDIARLHKDADRLMRAQGNGAGRGRMRADTTLRGECRPRGLVIASGEDVPRGTSLKARMLVIEVSRGDVDLDRLTKAQQAASAGQFAAAMAGYIGWLAPQMATLKDELPARIRELRDELRSEGVAGHARTPDNLASLLAGWECFLAFAVEVGAISEAQENELWYKGCSSLTAATGSQTEAQLDEDSATRFVRLLSAAIASRRAHLARRTDGAAPKEAVRWGWRVKDTVVSNQAFYSEEPGGELVGWLDQENEHVLLEPASAYNVVKRMARDQGVEFAVTDRVLWRRLREAGVLATRDADQNTVKRLVAGVVRRVLCIHSDTLGTGEIPISNELMGDVLPKEAS